VLPAERRVRRRAEFTVAVRRGRRVGSRGLVVHVANDHGERPARAGFVVGRSLGNAAARNRLRRRLRHLIAARLAELPAGMLIVVRALPPAAGFSARRLADELSAVLDRALPATSPAAEMASSS
jgi:ribonuclease P protein component